VFPAKDAADPLAALVRAVRLAEYWHLLGDLPGYRPEHLGETENVLSAAKSRAITLR
jgi:hypothetical protein